MSTFRDQSDRDWSLSFNFSALKRIKSIAHVDLLDPEALKVIGQDICRFVDVLYAACKPQADEAGVTDEQFGDLLVPCFNDAVEAFFEELEAFFRRLGRTALATLIQQIRKTMKSQETDKVAVIEGPEVTAKIAEVSRAETEKLKTTLLKELDRVIDGKPASDSQESSGSTSSSSTD